MLIKCTVEVEIFKSDTTGYVVFVGEIENDKKEKEFIHFVGTALDILEGDELELEGNWANHSKYGKQFKFIKYKKIIPEDEKGIIRYLASTEVKGIGEATAKRIVDQFGKDTFNIIRYKPNELTKIRGISKEKSLELSEYLNDQWEKLNLISFLQKYNISVNIAGKIFEIYKNKSLEKIKENPYSMLNEVRGIDFKSIDKIGSSLGIPFDDEYRIDTGIMYALSKIILFGHTCVEIDNLIPYTADILGIAYEPVYNGITRLAIDRKIYIKEIDNVQYISSAISYLAEEKIAQNTAKMTIHKGSNKKLTKEINLLEESLKMEFSAEQKEALRNAINNRLSIITGGPGTGKTTIIKGLIELLTRDNKSFVLCAPTGRAAKRITETTGVEAKTLHRLLAIHKTEDCDLQRLLDFDIEKIDKDVIIVDEMSMIDIFLMNNLMKSVRTKTKLILVGDVDQLPSVGPGSVLKDLIDSEKIKVTKLNQIYRQGNNSDIIINAHKVNNGEEPSFKTGETDMHIIETNSIKDTVEKIKKLLDYELLNYINCDSVKDVQVLTPMKKTELGSINLNKEIQKVLNPKISEIEKEHLGRIFRINDKVMQMENNYDISYRQNGVDGQGVYNGDIGYIRNIDLKENKITVLFEDGKEVEYTQEDLTQLDLAYSITVHKSQGSEFDVVLLPLLTGYKKLFTRNLLYTAMTRAKRLLIIIGSENTVSYMVKNVEEKKRKTLLKFKIRENIDKLEANL